MMKPQAKNMNRQKYDDIRIYDDLRITTGPGRYAVGQPEDYCKACYVPEPTIHIGFWGDAQKRMQKTDVESDLFNINRPTTKAGCANYDPNTDPVNKVPDDAMPECSFPTNFTRYNDPACTLRGTGWNRWQWLCENPQENVMVPFDWEISTRLASRDSYRPCIPKPLDPTPSLPAPIRPKEGSDFGPAKGQMINNSYVPPPAANVFPQAARNNRWSFEAPVPQTPSVTWRSLTEIAKY